MRAHVKQQEGLPTLLAGVQALCALCRSFLGPNKATKCVINPSNTTAPGEQTSGPIELLQAVDGEPTSTTLLLELLETQPRPGHAQVSVCGSGSSWLLAVVDAMLNATQALIQEQGAPLPAVLAGLDMAVDICEQVAHSCAMDLPSIAAAIPTDVLAQQWQSICSKLHVSAIHSDSGCCGGADRQVPSHSQQQGQQVWQQQDTAQNDCPGDAIQPALDTQGQEQQPSRQGFQRHSMVAHQGDQDNTDNSDTDWFFYADPNDDGSTATSRLVQEQHVQMLLQDAAEKQHATRVIQQSGQHTGRNSVARPQHAQVALSAMASIHNCGMQVSSVGLEIPHSNTGERQPVVSSRDEHDVSWFFKDEHACAEEQGSGLPPERAASRAVSDKDARNLLQQLQRFLQVPAHNCTSGGLSVGDESPTSSDDLACEDDQSHVPGPLRLADQQRLQDPPLSLGSVQQHEQGQIPAPAQHMNLGFVQQGELGPIYAPPQRSQEERHWQDQSPQRGCQGGQQLQQQAGRQGWNQEAGALTASQELLAAAALTTAHGATHETAVAAAALAVTVGVAIQQPSSKARSSPAQLSAALAELSERSQNLKYAKQVQVLELWGPAQQVSVVLPGVCLNLTHFIGVASADSLLCALVGQAGSGSAALVTNGRNLGSQHTSTASKVVRAAFIEGGLGLLAPCSHDGGPSTVCQAPWAALLQQQCKVVQVVGHPDSMKTADEELQQAVDGVMAILQPLQVQLLLLQGHVPPRLHEHILQHYGIVLLGSIPGSALSTLAAACGRIPAAGLAGLAAQGLHAVAEVSVCCKEQGRQDAHVQGALSRPITERVHHNQTEQCLVLQPAAGAGIQAAAAAATHLPVRVPAVPSACILLHAATQPGLQASATRLPACFARMRACFREGLLLPGGGVFELMCSHALQVEAEAQRVDSAWHTSAAVESGAETLQPWQQLNAVARETMVVWKSEVARAMAAGFQDIVVMILQNQGNSYTQALEHVTAACCTLRKVLHSVAHLPAKGQLQHSYTLPIATLQQLQACLHVGKDGESVEQLLVGDVVQYRVHALRAAAAFIQQILSTNIHVVNSAT